MPRTENVAMIVDRNCRGKGGPINYVADTLIDQLNYPHATELNHLLG